MSSEWRYSTRSKKLVIAAITQKIFRMVGCVTTFGQRIYDNLNVQRMKMNERKEGIDFVTANRLKGWPVGWSGSRINIRWRLDRHNLANAQDDHDEGSQEKGDVEEEEYNGFVDKKVCRCSSSLNGAINKRCRLWNIKSRLRLLIFLAGCSEYIFAFCSTTQVKSHPCLPLCKSAWLQ